MNAGITKEIKLCLKARFSLLWVVTPEENVVDSEFAKIAQLENFQIYTWEIARGWLHSPESSDKGNPMGALGKIAASDRNQKIIYILKDISKLIRPVNGLTPLNQLHLVREIKTLCKELEGTKVFLVLVADSLNIPSEIREEAAIVEFGYPNYQEIYDLINQTVPTGKLQINFGGKLDELIRNFQGLSRAKIIQVLRKCLVKGRVDEGAIGLAIAQKHESVKMSGVLEFIQPKIGLEDVGGLENLKNWVHQRRNAFSQRAREYGLPTPKGLLLAGIPGTGKSLTAKAIAKYLGLPLLRLDIGRLFSGLVGESEAKTRQMIKLVEAIAPCTLFIDELDKAFGSGGDGGTSSRVLSTLLTWMQEKESSVFVVATANRVEDLPPELLRKGRYDELFFLGLPTQRERMQIFEVHLSRVRPNCEFNCELLSQNAIDFSGAEIEQCILDAMYSAFSDNREFEQGDVINAIALTSPLAKTHKQQIQKLHDWAFKNGVKSASMSERDWRDTLENLIGKGHENE